MKYFSMKVFSFDIEFKKFASNSFTFDPLLVSILEGCVSVAHAKDITHINQLFFIYFSILNFL